MNRINLNKYNIRTDLILESLNSNEYLTIEKNDNITISRVIVDK